MTARWFIFWSWFIAAVTKRPPDFIIGDDREYLRRWWLIPRNPILNIYLHHIVHDDDDRALHDHPWPSVSIVLVGGYLEVMPINPGTWPMDDRLVARYRRSGSVVFRRPSAAHRLELEEQGKPCWSLFITGPRLRDWGFWCRDRYNTSWVPWQKFVDARDHGQIGRGCDQERSAQTIHSAAGWHDWIVTDPKPAPATTSTEARP